MSQTDFNDLHVSEGLGVVRDQVLSAVEKAKAGVAGKAANDMPANEGGDYGDYPEAGDESPYTPRDFSENSGATSRGIKVPDLNDLIKNYFLIWGSDTAFSEADRKIIKLSHIKEAVHKDVYNGWKESPNRVVVRGLVFDPQKKYDQNEYANLYDGFHLDAPVHDNVQPIIDHLWWMCSENEEVFLWVLNWIAYPLQNPGAKMATSIINYGLEGTGKSFLWDAVVKRMYGRYGIVVGQAQLESQFTTWKSHKLFVVAEEVVSRAEKAHYKGQIKYMITGESHIINEKNLAEREEDNLMNFVFLSNNTQPLDLDHGDRRYLALYMGKIKPLEYYKALGDWLDNGGLEAFYTYLCRIPLGDFNSHSKPPMTDAKQSLIDMAMPTPQYFCSQWLRGDLPIEVGPITTDDLYMAYTRWCEKSGEYKMSQRKFSGEAKRMVEQERVDICHPSNTSPKRTMRVWVPESWVPKQNRVQSIQDNCLSAHIELGRYLKGESS